MQPNVHPIVRQIIDRDCHVSASNRAVMRHVISKLREGYRTFRQLPKAERRQLLQDTQPRKRRRPILPLYSGMWNAFWQIQNKRNEMWKIRCKPCGRDIINCSSDCKNTGPRIIIIIIDRDLLRTSWKKKKRSKQAASQWKGLRISNNNNNNCRQHNEANGDEPQRMVLMIAIVPWLPRLSPLWETKS